MIITEIVESALIQYVYRKLYKYTYNNTSGHIFTIWHKDNKKRVHQLYKQGNVGRVNERYWISEYAKSSSDHSIMHFDINIMRVVFTNIDTYTILYYASVCK